MEVDEKCPCCGGKGWIVTGQTYCSPYGEQEQCPLCYASEYIKEITAEVRSLRDENAELLCKLKEEKGEALTMGEFQKARE